MPRFYFDVREGDKFVHDAEGEDRSDIEAARAEAIKALLGIARDHLSQDSARVSVEVRDEDGRRIACATLALHVE
jgi:hypothetical protein